MFMTTFPREKAESKHKKKHNVWKLALSPEIMRCGLRNSRKNLTLKIQLKRQVLGSPEPDFGPIIK